MNKDILCLCINLLLTWPQHYRMCCSSSPPFPGYKPNFLSIRVRTHQMPAEGFVFSSFSQKFPDLSWAAVRCPQRWKVWKPLISGSCTSPAAQAANNCPGLAINVWEKGVSSSRGDCSHRHLISSNYALKHNTHRHTYTHPARCSESKKADISVLNETNTMKRALKDIHMNLVLLPKEDLTYLPMCPYAT